VQVAVETDIDGMSALRAGDQRVAVGSARATCSDPVVPPAPERFSTTTDWLRIRVMA
jgi:hypothetical protein